VLDVDAGVDALSQQVEPGRREAPALRGDADQCGRGRVLQCLLHRPHDRHAALGCAGLARRIEDRDDVVAAVAQPPPRPLATVRRLAVVRIGAEAFRQDEVAHPGATPRPGASAGSCTPSVNSTPGNGSCLIRMLPSRSMWSNRLEMLAPAAIEMPDSIMQPSI